MVYIFCMLDYLLFSLFANDFETNFRTITLYILCMHTYIHLYLDVIFSDGFQMVYASPKNDMEFRSSLNLGTKE